MPESENEVRINEEEDTESIASDTASTEHSPSTSTPVPKSDKAPILIGCVITINNNYVSYVCL